MDCCVAVFGALIESDRKLTDLPPAPNERTNERLRPQKPRGPQNANMHNYLAAAAAAVFGLCKIRWSSTPPSPSDASDDEYQCENDRKTKYRGCHRGLTDTNDDDGYRKAARA